MKIKSKLTMLTTSMVFALVIAMGLNFYFQNRVDRMLEEESTLLLLNDTILHQEIELNKLLNNKTPVLVQFEVYNKFVTKAEEAFIQVNNLKILPTLNSTTVKAFNGIFKLKGLLEGSQKQLNDKVKDLISKFNKNDTSFSIKGIDVYANIDNYTTLLFYTNSVETAAFTVNTALEAASDILADQSEVIQSVVKFYKNLSLYISMGIVILTIITLILLSTIISSKITKSIKLLIDGLTVMIKGDFSKQIAVTSKDELGELCTELNFFQADLNKSLNKIKHSSEVNEKANKELIQTTTNSSTAAVEISANIGSINNQMSLLDNNITKSNSEVKDIVSFTQELSNFTGDQMSMVEQSTSAITEMIASISSITDLTQNNSKVVNLLEKTALEGDNKLTETTDLIEEINSSVNEINSMAEVIKNISDQTNLLAMNAAIEAAHAGDAGKGFAVVADEIRKLAEASALNSKDISSNLDSITTRFEEALVSGQSTREAFTNINDNIKQVTRALTEVSSSTAELNTGGSQILDAMENLRDISNKVTEKVEIMTSKTGNVTGITEEVSNISKAVSGAISEANIGFNEVTSSMSNLKDISDKVGIVSKEINYEITKFKTKELSEND